jgi:hypothetical protein
MFDLFGKAARLRTAEDIDAQVEEERSSWDRSEIKPPLIFEAVQSAVGQKINEHVKEYVQSRANEFAKVVEESLAKGFWTLVRQHFDSQMSWPIQNLQQQLTQALTGKT